LGVITIDLGQYVGMKKLNFKVDKDNLYDLEFDITVIDPKLMDEDITEIVKE